MLLQLFFWLSPIFYTLSYVLLSLGIVHKDKIYFIMNIVASLSSMASSFYFDITQTIFSSTIWLVITLLALLKKELKLSYLKKWMFYFSVFSSIVVSYFLIGELIEYRLLQSLGYSTVIIFTFIYFLFLNQKIEEHEFHLWNFLASIVMIIIIFLKPEISYPLLAGYVFWGLAGLYGFVKTFYSLSITAHEKV